MKQNKWKKLGHLYSLPKAGLHSKLLTHASNPTPVLLEGDVYRVFFSGRDVNNRSSIGAVDIDIQNQSIVHEHQDPFFMHGSCDSYYSDGVTIGNTYTVNENRYILFMGWKNPEKSHWYGEIGRLLLKPDLSLELDCDTPLLGKNEDDPISLSYPCIVKNDFGGYQMYYGSTVTWDTGNGEMLHIINYASSEDGHTWNRHGLAVPFELGKAQAFSRPSIIKNGESDYEMWVSYRSGDGTNYRIGHYRSKNCLQWTLPLICVGVDVSKRGWDSEMVEYPFVFDHNGQRYMLYNGNGFGKTGFGLAILSDE